MVNFRRFNGSSDVITLGLGALINTITFGTMAVLCRRADESTWDGPFCTRSAAGDAEMFLDTAPSSESPASALWCSYSGAQNNNGAFTVTAADDWVWIIVCKATGTVAPRYHKYVMSTQTWTRGDGAAGKPNATSPSGGSVQLGMINGSDPFNGDIAAVAVWTTALSDVALNGIVNNWTAGVLAASPQAAWLLNQASTATPLPDAVGTANQTAISGTSVQSGTIANWAEVAITPISGSDTSASAETGSIGIHDEDTGQSRNDNDAANCTDSATAHEVSRVFATNESFTTAVESASLVVMLSGSDSAAGTDVGSVVRPGDQHGPGSATLEAGGLARLEGGGKARLVTASG
jgi:hypothetical protein